jgi:hypothetical protein
MKGFTIEQEVTILKLKGALFGPTSRPTTFIYDGRGQTGKLINRYEFRVTRVLYCHFFSPPVHVPQYIKPSEGVHRKVRKEKGPEGP